MQNSRQTHFKDRALYYMSRSIVEQSEKGDDWQYNLKAVYGIFFLNFKMEDIPGKDPGQSLSEVMLVETETKTVFNGKLKQYFIELPRFVKSEKECVTQYDKWIYILKNLDTMETIPFAEERNAAFAKLAERAARANMTPAERAAYEESRKNIRDYYSAIDTAHEEGIEEGRAEGRAEGRVEGRAEGRVEGRAEGVDYTKRMIIANMHTDGFSVSIISKYVELTEAEVLNIIKSLS